jgi:hypothetical protein
VAQKPTQTTKSRKTVVTPERLAVVVRSAPGADAALNGLSLAEQLVVFAARVVIHANDYCNEDGQLLKPVSEALTDVLGVSPKRAAALAKALPKSDLFVTNGKHGADLRYSVKSPPGSKLEAVLWSYSHPYGPTDDRQPNGTQPAGMPTDGLGWDGAEGLEVELHLVALNLATETAPVSPLARQFAKVLADNVVLGCRGDPGIMKAVIKDLAGRLT